MIALVIFGSIAFYVLMGLTVGRLTYNHYITIDYYKELRTIKKMKPIAIERLRDLYHGDTIEEIALDKAKRYSMADENAIMCGFFWFGSIFWLVAVKIKNVKKFSIFFKNKVEREVDAAIAKVEHHEALLNTIKEAKAARIDTRELEQLAKSYKS
jgi:hypothetical protein